MTESMVAPIRTWLAAPMDDDVAEAIERLRRAPDVQRVAVMPDVHLAADVCIGVVAATNSLLYPQAVGGDIGCGMLAAAFDVEASALRSPRTAGRVLAGLAGAVPARRRNRNRTIAQPEDLTRLPLSDAGLEAARRSTGALEFATLGSGNHFVELQEDEEGRLWLMAHSGSRALGPLIRDHHLGRAAPVTSRLRALDAASEDGARYLHDVAVARRFADASRRAIAEEVERVVALEVGARLQWETLITTDHNHVSLECHDGRRVWTHRKGAMPARPEESGVLPGSMGTLSFHVEGRGNAESLCSSAHGAGRALSRSAARATITGREFRRQMEGVWHDVRLSDRIRDEAPSAYKDIRAVLRAQRDLVKVTRTLRPVLNYKGS